ncbi:glucose-fructose oxidoreductase domain-containing protein 1 [Diorhabda carinulata]|uniref:glucose-fructose oxidoreductase domain-containing protein 1 n=1 Tax=Diorhabda sublineata TaxID=1163346 RepID=UPI0024E06797|nr:glucose-fructose oxidoreductase domain-containing protein 1 [Diorhabda sublineata]XP_057657910.1 glucose-fructose oxidoreductase domain-containing protein 1 [Diorhabda carinulata]
MLPGIGVFGTGPVVKVLVPILVENGFKIEAIWSHTRQSAQETAKELKIPFFTDIIDEVLLRKDVDLIFVLCPPNLHAQISVKALGIGKHVVCDKPAGLNQSDALKMVGAGQYYPSLISLINHSFRFLPAITQMKKALRDNYLQSPITLIDIRIQSGCLFNDSDIFDWKCDDRMGGGTLNLIGSHVVDLITFLTGQKAIKVHGVVRTFTKNTSNINGIRSISAPDFCTFQMELKNGILVTATLNSHTVGSTFNQDVMICSSTGHLVVRGGDLFGRKNKGNEEVLYLDVEDLQCPVPNSVLPKTFVKGLCKMVAALREAFLPNNEKEGWIKEPVEAAATFEDGLYVQAVLSAIRESSQTRQWVKVKVMTEQPDKNELLSAVVRRTAITIS